MVKKQVMVVDDEKHILTLLKEVLKNEGFKVITAESGMECLTKLKKVKPDLIVMDMMMPKMSGYDTIKKIRENAKTKELRIVILTVSKIEEVSMFELSKYKILDYINKPFDIKEIVEKLKKYI
jgi:two-component system, OmpR family, alkaline phosphatase synthesis response regulator PhoP